VAGEDIQIKVGVVGGQDVLKLTNSISATSSNVRKLSAAFQQGKLTNQAYFVGINQQIPALRKLGLSYQDAQKKVWDYAKAQQSAVDSTKAAANNISSYTQQVKRQTNQLGVVVQQAGYQFGDFFVQVQSGTNYFVAFGQQATQLVGTFAMLSKTTKMISLFSGLGIAIPIITAIGAAWSRSSGKAEVAIDRQVQALERLKSAIKSTQDQIDKMRFGDSAAKFTQNEIAKLQNRISGTLNLIKNATSQLEQAKTGDQADAALLAKDFAEAELAARQAEVVVLQRQLGVLLDLEEAQRMLNGGNSTAANQQRALLLAKQVELRLAKEFKVEEEAAANRMRYMKTLFHDLENGTVNLRNGFVRVTDQIDASTTAALTLRDAINSISAPNFDTVAVLNAQIAAAKAGKSVSAAKASAEAAQTLGRAGASMDQIASGSAAAGSKAAEEERLNKILSGLVNPAKTTGGTVSGKIDTQEEYLAKLSREYDMKKKSLGMTDQQIKRNEFIFTLDEKIATMKTKTSEQDIQTERTKAIASYDSWQAAEKQAAIMGRVTGSIETMFMSFVDGTKSVGDAFKGMLRDILMQIYQEKVAKQAASGIGNFLSGLVGGATGGINIGKSGSLFGGASWSANGDIVASSGIQAFANGGVVSSPTMFQHGGGLGVMGEAGPEAIMPLKRGANGKLGVQMEGSPSQGNVVVNQTFNFSANGDDSVKKIIAQAAPQIAQMTQKQIMDSRRRGGSMKAAFG